MSVSWPRRERRSGDWRLERLFVGRESQDWEPGLTALSSWRLSSFNKQSISRRNVSPLFCRSFRGDSKLHHDRIVYVSVAEGFQNVTSWRQRLFNKLFIRGGRPNIYPEESITHLPQETFATFASPLMKCTTFFCEQYIQSQIFSFFLFSFFSFLQSKMYHQHTVSLIFTVWILYLFGIII